jgi:tRNA(fMet)-specific endonuclease VapC
MILLDTDSLTLLFAAHTRVAERYRRETDEVATTVITRIEILGGRFAFVMKAASGSQLLYAQQRLWQSEENLATLRILPVDAAAAAAFDQLRQSRKLKKIGRADLLIASIALAPPRHSGPAQPQALSADFRIAAGKLGRLTMGKGGIG